MNERKPTKPYVVMPREFEELAGPVSYIFGRIQAARWAFREGRMGDYEEELEQVRRHLRVPPEPHKWR